MLVAIVAAACSQPSPPPPTAPAAAGGPAVVPAPAAVPVDAPAPSQEEKLAAIQKAMNELDEAAQACWAAAATDRFDIAGELKLLIDIEPSAATAQVVTDTVREPKLATCLVQLLGGYRWAPPLYGETIQLPFKFDAPAGQSVVDRRLVEWRGQAHTSVAVLLDEANSGNAGVSMFEVAIAPRASTGMRVADRAELWYFLGEAEVKSAAGTGRARTSLAERVQPGSMMFVPRGAVREVIAARPDMRAVVVVVPGGREGTARAGALPTAEKASGTALPVLVPKGTPAGPATIFVEPSVIAKTPLSASVLALPDGANVAEHVHAKETELLYILEGSGTMTIAGQALAITPTSVVQVPPNTKHAFTASAPVRALQIYTPAGPEQRFKKKP